jgi:C-terminal processing protease CtpA/Prc
MKRFSVFVRHSLSFTAISLICSNALAQLTPDQSKQDVRVLTTALKALHPALTKYKTQSEIDAAFTAFEARGNAARSPAEMYLAATELAAAIRCGHTWTNVLNQQRDARAALFEAANKLPFTLTQVENRWLVLASADAQVKAGDEVMALGGVAASEIAARMMPYLRADGSSDGKRLRQLNHDRFDFSQMDIVWPLLLSTQSSGYLVALKREGREMSVTIKAVTLDARKKAFTAQGIVEPSDAWTFRIDAARNAGVLTLPTFSFWRSKFDWKAFLRERFAELNAKRIPNLIIDIRDNEGGDGAIGGEILSYLLNAPYQFESNQSATAYERVPYPIVKYLDTWDYSFFDRTGQVEKITIGPQAGLFSVKPQANLNQTIAPAAERYAGKTYVLIGPENSSATFQFAKLVKESRAATLVGEPTGGNLRGLNGGQLLWVTLPNSGVAVDIPLLAAAYDATTPDAGISPDVAVSRTFEGRKAGRDEVMDAVLKRVAASVK